MLSRIVRVLLLIVIVGALDISLCLSVRASSDGPSNQGTKKETAQAQQQTNENPGERIFRDNCSRCHTAPMSISPRITGTVVMHMRVRARLSRQDEKLLLNFLSP